MRYIVFITLVVTSLFSNEVKVNIYNEINQEYLKSIKPIFRMKCFDCHSMMTHYPDYYQIPGIKQMMDQDIKTGRSVLDFTNNFPFKSYTSPLNDLKNIKKSTINGDMPPLRYRLAHGNAKVSEDEKSLIIQWAERGIKALEAL